ARDRIGEVLAEALFRLLVNFELLQRMGLAGRRFVEGNFTWDICARKMLKIYCEAAESIS
ncbi:MAG: hypothetical protein LBB87_02795, partial [Nitrososphaerota archaeon]|nr:hypothetical protein [Nitrososphaerota archaeon]